ncbi:MAG: hypothetical protein N3D84_01630 [Candidatus Woesearchaeota archaeon]|nr:hypothetical protein [Candidatus Woesearchaeota archaeon]
MGNALISEGEEPSAIQTIDNTIRDLLDVISSTISNCQTNGKNMSYEDLFLCYYTFSEALSYFTTYKSHCEISVSSTKNVIENVKNIINGAKEESIAKKRAEKNLENCLHSCEEEENKIDEKIEYYKQRLIGSFEIIELYKNKILDPSNNNEKYKELYIIRDSILEKLTALG